MEQRYYRYRTWKAVPKPIVNSVVDEILKIARLELKKPLKQLVVLDVGCGSGAYSFALERYVKRVVGVEPYKPMYDRAVRNKRRFRSNVSFLNKPIESCLLDEKFDLVISLTTIEHMPNAEESFKKIFSLMRNGGIIYLTAPNKLWPIESHYKLPFLSWLPLPLANFYVKMIGVAESYEDCSYSKTYFGMKRFFSKFPCEYRFILPRNEHSAYLGCGSRSFSYSLIKKLGFFLIKKSPFFWMFSKGFIILIRKKV